MSVIKKKDNAELATTDNQSSEEKTVNLNDSMKYNIIKIVVIVALAVMVIAGLTHPSSIIGTGKLSVPESTKDSKNGKHDFVSKDGKTVADFADPIITKSEKEAKITVYSQNVSDKSKMTQNLLFNWLKKNQTITYKAKVEYYVDLSLITDKSISVDNGSKTVTITIPKPQYQINLNYKDFEIGDPSTNTILPASDMKFTFENIQELDEEARKKIDAKVQEDSNKSEAESSGIEQIRKIYEPIISAVDKDYTVNVEY